MIIPVYMDEADLKKVEYFKATDLEKYQRELRDGAKGSEDLRSEETLDQYCKQLRRLTEILGQNVEWLLSNSVSATTALLGAKRRDGKSMLEEWGTLRGLVMSVLALLKYLPDAKKRWPDGYKVWSDVLSEQINPLAKKKDASNELTERQLEGEVEWKDVVAMREKLLKTQPTSPEALLLAIYSMRKGVARADFGDLRIYRPPRDPVPPHDSKERQAHPNYVVWSRSDSPGAGDMELHLVEYKSAKHHGEIRDKFSPELTQLIAASLRQQPRAWLFVQPQSGKPYDGKAFSRWACRVLKRLFKRPLTLQVLRHAGVTGLDFNKLTEQEREDIARDGYQHSSARQMAYRIVKKGGVELEDTGDAAGAVTAATTAVAAAAAARLVEDSQRRAREKRESTKKLVEAAARAKARVAAPKGSPKGKSKFAGVRA